MKEILGFHLHHCPYCANAFRAIEELQAENPAFKEIKIRCCRIVQNTSIRILSKFVV